MARPPANPAKNDLMVSGPQRVLQILWSLPLATAAGAALFVFLRIHPMPLPALAFVCVMLIASLLHRHAWLFLLPALLPVVDQAPRTGQIFITESDALVLAILLVLALRMAWQAVRGSRSPQPPPDSDASFRLGVGRLTLLSLFAVSYLISTHWWELSGLWSETSPQAGYFSSLNGPRLAKGYLFALLLIPFLWSALARDNKNALRVLMAGLLTGLMLVALATIWERWLFVGFSNFSSDYRTTALFWEANVGGAMIDAWLALTVPFLIWLALHVRQPLTAMVVLAGLALAGYAVFTTFSRGLYVGLAAGVAITLLLLLLQARRRGWNWRSHAGATGLLLCTIAIAALLPAVFATGGYRGLAATIAVAFLLYLVAPAAATRSRRGWIIAILLLVLGTVLSAVFLLLVPRGVYLVFGLSVVVAFVLLASTRLSRLDMDVGALALGAVLWAVINAGLVTVYWSEGTGWVPAGLFVAAAVTVLLGLRWRPALSWQPDVPGGLGVLLSLGALGMLVLITGTYYASERFSTVSQDLSGRERHWSLGASLPYGGSERWLGIGTGQFAQRFFWSMPADEVPGTHQLISTEEGTYLQLIAGHHVMGFGEMYRLTQRIDPAVQGPFSGYVRARTVDGGRLHVEICRKHLLYEGGCALTRVQIPEGGEWAELTFSFDHQRLGEQLLPARPTAFSIASANRDLDIDVAEIVITDARGEQLLRNTDFSAGSDFWFFSSDRNHLPWHAKNLWLHYLVEQGWLGAAVFSVLYVMALYRLTLGAAKAVAWAPPLAGALIAFGTVGLFDSLVDAPRITLLMSLTMLLALGLCRPPRRL